MSKQPHWHHQQSCNRVGHALEGWSEPMGAGVTLTAPGIIFALDEAVAPDLVWVGRERFDQIAGEDGKLHGAPDLVVEVLSPGETNAERDRALKLKLYSRRAVREYWILDWQQVTIDVYRRDNGALVLIATLRAEDTFTSPMLPGFAASVSHLRAPR